MTHIGIHHAKLNREPEPPPLLMHCRNLYPDLGTKKELVAHAWPFRFRDGDEPICLAPTVYESTVVKLLRDNRAFKLSSDLEIMEPRL